MAEFIVQKIEFKIKNLYRFEKILKPLNQYNNLIYAKFERAVYYWHRDTQ